MAYRLTMNDWLGRVQAAALGGVASSSAVLLLACQWDIELLQSGSSSGRTLFLLTWLGTGLTCLLIHRVRTIFSAHALLAGGAACLSVVLHHLPRGQLPFDGGPDARIDYNVALTGVDFTIAALGLLLLVGGAWALRLGRPCA